MKILVVDDEASVRAVCGRVLRAEGAEVAAAASGAEAIGRLGEGWDVVLTDIAMPGGVDGLELLRRVRSSSSADVLMMTAYPALGAVMAALKAGAYDFILKPFDPEFLRAALRRCADKRRLSVELSRERSLREERARTQKIRDAFGLFVTPEIAEHVLALPPEALGRGTRRRVTVLFADVRQFTPFAEAVSPERAVETLNGFFACVIAAIRAEGGTLNKFLGDGALALFGAPLDMSGHESAAVRAALRIVEAVAAFERERAAGGLPPLRVGVGIETGDVVAGCLGTEARTEYTVIGRAVNMAARLEKAARPGQILLGRETAAAVRSTFTLRPVSSLRLPGVSDSGAVSELSREAGAYAADTGRR